MLGLDARTARITWTVFVIALLIWVTYLIRNSILIFVAALFVAYMLAPLLDLICRWAPKRVSRTAALALVYVVLLIGVGSLLAYFGSLAIEQGTELATALPGMIKQHQDVTNWPVPSWLEPYKDRLLQSARDQLDQSTGRILPLAQRAIGGVMGVLGSVMFVILVPILTFLFLKDASQLRDAVVAAIPARHRHFSDQVLEDVHVLIGQYIRALAILSVLTSVAYLLFFEIIRLPYAVLLALLAAPLEFIPFFGPLIGTVMVLGVALITGYPHFWWIVVFFVCYRAFQDYWLQPYLMSKEIELHPLVVMFGALAGEELAGLWGMFLSVPVMATAQIVLSRARRKQRDEEILPTRP